MADFTLIPQSALNGFSRDYEGITLVELSDFSIVSLAPALGDENAFAKQVKEKLKLNLPEPGHATKDDKGDIHLLRLQVDQYFYMRKGLELWPERSLKESLGTSGYVSDQSDSWAILSLEGPRVSEALERICMLDLSEDGFPAGSVSRTVMEHLGVLIYRLDDETFWLFSAASSANSFCRAVVVSCDHVS